MVIVEFLSKEKQVSINGICYTRSGLEAKVPKSKTEENVLKVFNLVMQERNVLQLTMRTENSFWED